MAKLPWVKLFTEQILADLELSSCSLQARGLWLTLFCLMHRSDRKGYLDDRTGMPLKSEQLARMARCSVEEVDRGIQELITSGVFSVSADGHIYSRRMVREAQLSEIRSKAGRKGAEIANLPRQNERQTGGKRGGKPPGKPLDSSSSLEEEKRETIPPEGGGVGEGVLPRQNERQTGGKNLTIESLAQQAAFNRGWGNDPGEIGRWQAVLEDLVGSGIPIEVLGSEIKKKPPERERSESSWDFKKRLKKKPNGYGSDEEETAKILSKLQERKRDNG
jgi:hypothetical protein